MAKYLAHFVNFDGSLGGSQEILAKTEEEAKYKGSLAAKRWGKKLADITGPDSENEDD